MFARWQLKQKPPICQVVWLIKVLPATRIAREICDVRTSYIHTYESSYSLGVVGFHFNNRLGFNYVCDHSLLEWLPPGLGVASGTIWTRRIPYQHELRREGLIDRLSKFSNWEWRKGGGGVC